MKTRIFACSLLDEKELMSSSSGGFFSAISNCFINQYAIASAVYDYNADELKYRLYSDIMTRNEARGSKYFQASTSDVFCKAYDYLVKNPEKKLLFVGPGCYADGFRNFSLAKGILDRTLIVDLVCHGVSSPLIWKDYIKDKPDFDFLSFKDKRNGWKKPYALIKYGAEEWPINDFITLYNSNCILRPSCYHCQYTSISRKTDITIGDFWGVEKHAPDFYSPVGNSLVLVHTEKGLDYWEQVKNQMKWIEIESKDCYQPNLVFPTPKPLHRCLYWHLYRKIGINGIVSPPKIIKIFNRIYKKKYNYFVRKHKNMRAAL